MANFKSFKLVLFTSAFFCFCAVIFAGTIKVKRVYDGDTIKLENGKKVQYIGIDAPEKRKIFYKECKQANKVLVDKKEVTLHSDRLKTDRHGRLLRYVYVDNLFVNAELIKRGYAVAHIVPPNMKYADLFLSLQKKARKNHRGIWAFEDPNDEPYYVGSKNSRKFHRPKCPNARAIDFDNRVIFRNREEALNKGFAQHWDCNPLFKINIKRK